MLLSRDLQRLTKRGRKYAYYHQGSVFKDFCLAARLFDFLCLFIGSNMKQFHTSHLPWSGSVQQPPTLRKCERQREWRRDSVGMIKIKTDYKLWPWAPTALVIFFPIFLFPSINYGVNNYLATKWMQLIEQTDKIKNPCEVNNL